MNSVKLNVAGGLAQLEFHLSSLGDDGSDTSPGIGFEVHHFVMPYLSQGKYVGGTGVISRYDAARLLALLAAVLNKYPPVSARANPADVPMSVQS